MASNRHSDLRLIMRVLHFARPYWLQIVVIFLLSLLTTPLSLLSPIPLKIAVDSVIGSEPLPGFLHRLIPSEIFGKTALLLLAAALMIGIELMSGIVTLCGRLIRSYTSEKLVRDFRAKLFRHAQNLSLEYHDSKGTSDALYRVMWDATSISSIAIDGLAPFITAAFTLVSMFLVIYWIDYQLAIVALAVAPILYATGIIYRRQSRRKWREVKELDSATLSVVQETLGAIRVVKAFGQEDYERDRFIQRSDTSIGAKISAYFITYGFNLAMSLFTITSTALVMFLGVKHVLTGVITLGSLLIVMSYLTRLYGPLSTITKKLGSMQSSLTSIERANHLLSKAPDVTELPDAKSLKHARGEIEFRNVSFAYDQDQRVLQNISFKVPAGMKIGIAGRTGAGKTTLISLLARFYDPTEGMILLDDKDLRGYRVADLRNQFAIVLQEPVLFSSSIFENISYARPGANEKDVILAAKAANAHEFIVALADGYDTRVGERGMRLSGGERQRISLARAFLKDAPILILDEPTSSVDMTTESVIVEAMDRLMQNRTTFMIAHRLTTLERCDVLLVIDDGRLVDMRSDVTIVVRQAVEQGGLVNHGGS
jgi:ATP-binding cassette subfamily B protein